MIEQMFWLVKSESGMVSEALALAASGEVHTFAELGENPLPMVRCYRMSGSNRRGEEASRWTYTSN
jgi:hypothetical protein